jgi:hypothetical protein
MSDEDQCAEQREQWDEQVMNSVMSSDDQCDEQWDG